MAKHKQCLSRQAWWRRLENSCLWATYLSMYIIDGGACVTAWRERNKSWADILDLPSLYLHSVVGYRKEEKLFAGGRGQWRGLEGGRGLGAAEKLILYSWDSHSVCVHSSCLLSVCPFILPPMGSGMWCLLLLSSLSSLPFHSPVSAMRALMVAWGFPCHPLLCPYPVSFSVYMACVYYMLLYPNVCKSHGFWCH